MSMGRSFVAPVTSALAAGGNAATMGLAIRFLDKVPARLIDRILPKPGTWPRRTHPGNRLLHRRDVHHNDNGGPVPGHHVAEQYVL